MINFVFYNTRYYNIEMLLLLLTILFAIICYYTVI